MQHLMNISAFNPQLDSTSGAWISSVSERLLKEIKNCLAHTNDSQQTQAKSYSIVFSAFFFWKENFNFFYFYVFFCLSCSRALCISWCSENMSPRGLLMVLHSNARINRCPFQDYSVLVYHLELNCTSLYLPAEFMESTQYMFLLSISN